MKRKPAIAGEKYETFDFLPGGTAGAIDILYKGAHVRQFTSKLRKTVTGPSGEILYFVCPKIKGTKVWRAFVAWRPEEGDRYDQFVNVELLRLENTPPPPPLRQFGDELKHDEHEPEPEPEPERTECPGDPNDETATCGGELRFDPDLVGDTCGGLTLRGWMVCQKCSRAWLAPKGMGVAYDGDWKLAGGGRSVETGVGRIRVDGGTNVEALMKRIVKLPELELEVARLRKERPRRFPVTDSDLDAPDGAEVDGYKRVGDSWERLPQPESSPWHECKLVVNGTELRDGDRILKINQPESKDNGVYIVRLERP